MEKKTIKHNALLAKSHTIEVLTTNGHKQKHKMELFTYKEKNIPIYHWYCKEH